MFENVYNFCFCFFTFNLFKNSVVLGDGFYLVLLSKQRM